MEEAKLKAHITKAHSTERRYTCSICTSQDHDSGEDVVMEDFLVHAANEVTMVSFPSYSALQDHIRDAHPPTCEYCHDTFTTQRELARHVELLHSSAAAQAVFKCEEPGCGKAFTKRGNLKEHIRIIHKGEKRFLCGDTDVSGSSKFIDEDGTRREWDGDGCGRTFTTKASLEEHIRTQHLGMEGTSKVKKRQRLIDSGRDPGVVNARGKSGAKPRRDKGLVKTSAMSRLTGLDGGDDVFGDFNEDHFWLGGYDDAEVFDTQFGASDSYDWAAEAEERMMLDRMAGVESLPAVDVQAKGMMPVDPALEAVSAFLQDSA